MELHFLSNLLLGFSVALSWWNLFFCLLGVLLGTVIGVLPGIGPTATIAMLLPVTFSLSPVTALIMLAGIYYGAQYGGSTTAILVNLPGEPAAHSGKDHVAKVAEHLKQVGVGRIGTVIGRYYAMDRDRRWDRTEVAYRALVNGEAERTATDPVQAVLTAYDEGTTDEFIHPYVITDAQGAPLARIKSGDTIIGFNFRGDRMRQMYYALMNDDFAGFKRDKLSDLHFVSMGTWGDDVYAPRAFVRPAQATCLAEVLSNAGKTQLHTAETEKFRHVTFFFNGQRDEPYPGEERILVDSPKDVPTYDLKPQMSAEALTDRAVQQILSKKFDFILLNYANPDMVGHTGVLEAAIKAVETVDGQLKRLLDALKEVGATVLVTADHGNCEMMIDPETGMPHTAHTMSRVPFILITPDGSKPPMKPGNLCNVSPTILELMGIPVPADMDAESLLVKQPQVSA